MKNLLTPIVCVLILCALTLTAFKHQNDRVKRGDLVVIDRTSEGGFEFVDKTAKTITDKTSVFPIVLWEDKGGNVFSQRHMIAYRAYIVANVPANATELAHYRSYFPTRS